MNRTKIVLPDGKSWIKYYRQIPNDLQVNNKLFKELWQLHPEERDTIVIRGKSVKVPRYQQSYGKDYYYTGRLHKALPIKHEYLQKLLEWVKKKSKCEYNQMIINWYENGNNYIGPHSDDTRPLVEDSAIYSFSFGQPRDFVITSIKPGYKKVLHLGNNSLVIMGGEMQKHYKHAIPKRSVKKCPYKRINITFRLFKE